ncbi:MAG: DUF2334 domain-containing protein [Clostridia bacterium]|nr:DUF2334 domain-containing protein [Clostridia bacterium]
MKKFFCAVTFVFILVIAFSICASAHDGNVKEINFDSFTANELGVFNSSDFSYPARTAYTEGATEYADAFLTPESDGSGQRLTLKVSKSAHFGFGIPSETFGGPYTKSIEIQASITPEDFYTRRIIGAYDCWHSTSNPTLMMIHSNGYFYVFGTGMPSSYKAKAGSTYTIKARINTETGYSFATVYENGKVFFTYSKKWDTIINYKWTSIYFYQNYYSATAVDGVAPVSVAHIDDFSIKNVNRVYSFDNYYDFENYTGNEAGNAVPEGFSRVIYVDSKCDTANGEIKRLYSAETAEKGKCLEFVETKQSTSSEDAILLDFDAQKNFGSYFTDNYLLEFSLMRKDKLSNIIVRMDAEHGDLLNIFQSGYMVLAGNNTGITLSETNKWYDIKIRFSIPNKSAHIEVYSDGNLVGSYGCVASNSFPNGSYTDENGEVKPCIKNMYIGFSRHYPITQKAAFLLDDFRITPTEAVYGICDEGYETFDIAYSTPGTAGKMMAGNPVKVTFNNKINKESFSSASITLNGEAVADGQITFEDEYTVALNLATLESSNYHLAFTGVCDENGNTLTDYIEFETLPSKYDVKSITFKNASGEELQFLEPGDISAIVTFASNDGKKRPALIWAGLYDKNGKLCSVDFEKTNFEAAEKTNVLTLTVPQDGTYKIKCCVWTDVLLPIESELIYPRVAVFRFDDVRNSSRTLPNFETLATLASENEIPVAMGIICNSLVPEDDTSTEGTKYDIDKYYDKIKALDDNEFVEIWCHGYTHHQTTEKPYIAEFNSPLEDQIATLEKCKTVLKEKCGIDVVTMGVPHNLKNSDTVLAMEAVNQYKVLMGSGSKYESDSFIHLNVSSPFEKATGDLMDLESIKEAYAPNANNPAVVFLGHAGWWTSAMNQTFVDFASWLKNQNVEIMTPTEYYNFIN